MSIKRQQVTSPLVVGTCITLVVTVAGTAYALMNPRSNAGLPNPAASPSAMPMSQLNSDRPCQTVTFDPQPPLNVRSQPNDKTGKVLKTLPNGIEVTIAEEKEGWLRISAPEPGWIFKKLTRQDCGVPQHISSFTAPAPSPMPFQGLKDQGSQLYAQSIEHYQSGDLPSALMLAKLVPVESPAYEQAQVQLHTMPRKWNQAQVDYNNAQQALSDRRWSDVLKVATQYPDIRFWRQKLAPMVKQAILMQHIIKDDEDAR